MLCKVGIGKVMWKGNRLRTGPIDASSKMWMGMLVRMWMGLGVLGRSRVRGLLVILSCFVRSRIRSIIIISICRRCRRGMVYRLLLMKRLILLSIIIIRVLVAI